MRLVHYTGLIFIAFLFCLLVVSPVNAVTWTSAGGCWTATDGAYSLVMWNATGSYTYVTNSSTTSLQYLVVAGGGGGGSPYNRYAAGGGGAGGFLNGTLAVAPSTGYTVVVGTGGNGGVGTEGVKGGSSNFSTIGATGGGGGGYTPSAPATGGSGGGGGVPAGVAGSGIAGQGFAGGTGGVDTATGRGGGGGGASVVGQNGGDGTGGNGGNGLVDAISGTPTYYAGGGGGSSYTVGSYGTGGLGGGGNGGGLAAGSAGTNALGGGGGGASYNSRTGGKGGSGVVIIRYLPLTTVNASFTPTGVPIGQAPFTVQFNDTSTGFPTAWNWSFQNVTGNNTQVWFNTTQNPKHTFGAGNFSIKLNASKSTSYNISTQLTWVNISSSNNYLGVYSPYSKLVMHMNGANGGTVFIDENGHSVTRSGNTVTSTAQKYLGNASGSFDGVTDYLNVAASTDFNLGTDDFTIMFWVRPASNSNYDTYIGRFDSATTLYKIDYGDAGKLRFEVASTALGIIADYTATSAQTLTVGTWNQIVVERSGTQIYVYLNGNAVPMTANTAIGTKSIPSMTSDLIIGTDAINANRDISGYLDEIGVWRGVVIPIGQLYPQPQEINEQLFPVSTFTPTGTTTGIVPLPVQFNDTSTGVPTSWMWNYTGYGTNVSSGTFSNSQNPKSAFGLGNFSISLIVTNGYGSATSTQTTWVNTSLGTVSFTPTSTQTGYSPFLAHFNGSTTMTTPTGWNWAWQGFGTNTTNGTFDTVQNGSGVFAEGIPGVLSVGNFSIKLNVTNAYGTVSSTQTTWVNTTTPLTNANGMINGTGYTVWVYNTSTTDGWWIVPANVTQIQYLIVGGGGTGGTSQSGGSYGNGDGGGGGGGGLLSNTTYNVTPGTAIPIIVGGSDQNSAFNGITAYAGGTGGHGVDHKSSPTGGAGIGGGSGGGGGTSQGSGGGSYVGQGNDGQNAAQYSSGAGGGAGSNGASGGLPLSNNITGANVDYAGGGGAAAGGGGTSSPTIGGGGGGTSSGIGTPGAGKTGTVLIRYSFTTTPVATFTPLGTVTGAITKTVQFNDTSIYYPTAWNWSFQNVTGNNTQVWFNITQNPAHTFGVGNFLIKLNASNSAGFNISTQITWINVSPPSYADATFACGDNLDYTCVVFNNATQVGQWDVPIHVSKIDYLVVGGGGSGGYGTHHEYPSYGHGDGGGGGGGGVLYCTTYTLPVGATSIPVIVGGSDEDSVFYNITAYAGGAGGVGIDHKSSPTGGAGIGGGSGGGGGTSQGNGGGSYVGQGHDGQPAVQFISGTGGGAGSDGASGGLPLSNSITGTAVDYAGGGGASASGAGGATSLTPGGGGGGSYNGAAIKPGQNGTVIIKYWTPALCAASFAPKNPNTIYSGDTISFIDHSWEVPYYPVSWSWSYQGSGTNTSTAVFSTSQNPVALFTEGTPGIVSNSTFNITLTIVDSNGATHVSCQNTSVLVQAVVTHAAYQINEGTCTAYIYDTFNQSTNLPYFFVTPYYQGFVQYLVVGGGGAGGQSWQPEYQTPGYGGGGGAGGFIYNGFFLPGQGDIFKITVGAAYQNSSVISNNHPSIIAYRGGKGGDGFPDTQQNGEPGGWGGSGGGGGSGGTANPWQCIASGGLGTPLQGYQGGCGYGGYALTTGGGGGGAASPGVSGQYGSSGGSGKYNNITFTNTLYSEGGYGEVISGGGYPCLVTTGSGGRADYSKYVGSCRSGQNGTVVFQVCPIAFPEPIVTAPMVDIAEKAKVVMFVVRSATGAELVGAEVSIQGFSTTTGSWDWLQTMIGIPIDEAPIHNTLMSGTTDSLGDIEFLMLPTVKYNVTTSMPGYTFPAMTIVPHDNEYIITANPNTTYFGWTTPEPVENGQRNIQVTSNKVNSVLGQITIVYDDTGFTTTGGFVNITSGGILLHSIPITTNSTTEVKDIALSKSGTSVKVSANITTSGGNYIRDFFVEFPGEPVTIGGLPADLIMWVAFGLMLLTTMLAGIKEARHVSIVLCIEAWSFLSFGWFQPMVDKIGIVAVIGLFSFATVITIVWNLREGLLDELMET